MFDSEQIQNILPQRYPFLMVDRVLECEPGKRIVVVKNVTVNEAFFAGHFPEKPIMPGVLIIEAMAQASIILFFADKAAGSGKSPSYYLGSVKARFLSPVVPGDQLKITVEPIKVLSGAGIVNAVAEVAGKEVARSELSFSAKEESR